MTRLLKLALLAFALGLPGLAGPAAAQAAAPPAFEEVAQAGTPEARPRQRQRRPRAERPRTNRQQAQRPRGNRQQAQRPRRPRPTQG
jgi:hypothetical protein